MLRHHAKQLISRLGQFFVSQTALVNQLEVKAGRGTQFDDSWQVKGEHHRIFNLREVAHRSTGDRFNFVFFTWTLAPVFQRDERDAGVLAAAGEAEAVNRKHGFHVVLLFGEIVIRHLIQHFLRTLLGGAGRQLRHAQEYPLVLVRQERARQTDEQPRHAHHDDQIQDQITTGAAQNVAYAVGVVVRALIEHAVKPTEETGGRAMAAFLNRLQHGGAQRWRQDQRHQYRQRHRRNDGDGELAIDGPG